jgi:hypothetical protein
MIYYNLHQIFIFGQIYFGPFIYQLLKINILKTHDKY